METRTLSREELYSRVWTTPMRRLAVEFGLSDVGLSKICRKHNIPTPPVGFWAKKAHGKAMEQTPLPPADGADVMVEIVEQPPRSEVAAPVRRTVQNEKIAALIAEVSKPQNKLVVSETLHAPHPSVVTTRRSLDEATPDKYGLLSPIWRDRASSLNVAVAKQSVNRALRIMNALVKALDRFGFQFKSTDDEWRKKFRVTFMGEAFEFRLREKTKRQDHVPTEAEKAKQAKYHFQSYPAHDYIPTGMFELAVSNSGYWSPDQTWRDGKDHRVEDDLNEFVVVLLEMVDRAQVARVSKERAEREQQERERRRYDLEQRRRKEQKRVDALLAEAQSWEKSRLIRTYVAAVREKAINGKGIEPGSDLDRWLTWASAQADRFDPLTASPASVLDPDPELDQRL
jgi:hypothetical protein